MDVIPLLIGTTDPDGAYHKFKGFGVSLPDVHTRTSPELTVRETVTALFKLQGIFVNPTELKPSLGTIVQRCSSPSSYPIVHKTGFKTIPIRIPIPTRLTSFWPKYRPQWHNQSELGPESVYTCVQCKKQYLLSENAPGSCQFHLEPERTTTRLDYSTPSFHNPNFGWPDADPNMYGFHNHPQPRTIE